MSVITLFMTHLNHNSAASATLGGTLWKKIIAVDLNFKNLKTPPEAAWPPALSFTIRLILISFSPSCQLFFSLNIFHCLNLFVWLEEAIFDYYSNKTISLAKQWLPYLHQTHLLSKPGRFAWTVHLSQRKQYASENTFQLQRLTPSLFLRSARVMERILNTISMVLMKYTKSSLSVFDKFLELQRNNNNKKKKNFTTS